MSQSKPSQEVWLDCPRCGVELCRILEHHFDQPGLTWSCPRCGVLAHLCVETRGDHQVAYLTTDEELPSVSRDRSPELAWALMKSDVRAIIDALILRGREAEVLAAALLSYDLRKPAGAGRREYERGVADLIAYRKRSLN